MAAAHQALLENAELMERNRHLELKLRYVQSVNTIFRQRVALMMQALTQRLVEVQLQTNINVNLPALMSAVNESAAAEMPSLNTEAQYWQDRFIDAMSSIQPISQSEVETLCRLIREKVSRDAIVTTNTNNTNNTNNNNNRSLSSSSTSNNNNHNQQHTVDALLSPIGSGGGGGSRSESNFANANSPSGYGAAVAAEVASLRDQLQASQARVKSLSFRLGELRKQQEQSEGTKSDANVALTAEVATLMGTVRELRVRHAEQESLNRRLVLENNILRTDKNLQLQNLARMQGVCAAVMRESQCAVNEGLAATQMNETALLKRQMDTFELVLRKSEQELVAAKRQSDEKDQMLMERDREVQALQLRLESKEKTIELLRTRCSAMATAEKDQREEQVRTITALKARLAEAVAELETAYTTKNIASGLQKVSDETEKFAAFRSSLGDLQKQFDALRVNYAALTEELVLAAKQGRPPRDDVVSSEAARVLVAGGDVKVPREAVLRSEGAWKEVRDLNEGSVFYVTTQIAGTPFDPNKNAAATSSSAAATAAPLTASPSMAASAAASAAAAKSPAPSSSPQATSLDALSPSSNNNSRSPGMAAITTTAPPQSMPPLDEPSPAAEPQSPGAASSGSGRNDDATATGSDDGAGGGGGRDTPSASSPSSSNQQSEDNSQPLPDGWKEKIDPKTGRTYYYNPSTKETSWKRPGCTHSAKPADAAE